MQSDNANYNLCDPLTRKPRELDLSAIIGESAGSSDKHWVFALCFIECVNNPYPLAFLTKEPEISTVHVYDIFVSGLPAHVRRKGGKSERAGIVDYDGNIPRAWAEGFARLHPDRPPGDVPLKRGQTFVDDCGRFLDAGWAEKAAVLGWGPLDLFGCDRERPFARVDQAGLLWLLSGGKLIALTEATAAIERQTGARQTVARQSR